jgi:hypothetical protein
MNPDPPNRGALKLAATLLAALVCGAMGGAACGGEVTAVPAASSSSPPGASDERLPIGMNLGLMSAMNRELVFVDVMKMSTPWYYTDEARATGGRMSRRPHTRVPVNEHGWPLPETGRAVSKYMLRDMDGHYPAGDYLCTWEGKGRIGFSGAAKVTERSPERLVVQVRASNEGVCLTVKDVDPHDPVRNIRFLMPGFEEAKSPFNPLFVERLAPFQVIRFYPWMRPHQSDGVWEERPTPEDARQTSTNGVAVEYMVALCNELGARPWFTMPHTADDEYVRAFATIVKENLDPELSMYVEFSNEVWNSDFPQARWAQAIAREEGIPAPAVTAREALRDWRIWHEVFGNEKQRVIRVAAGQTYNPAIAKQMLDALDGEVDAVAIGAYFGFRVADEGFDRSTSAEEIVKAARRTLDGSIMKLLARHRKMADKVAQREKRPISLISYEGGQHIVARLSFNPAGGPIGLSPQEVNRAQDLPAMYDAYRALIEEGQKAGLELLVAYDFAGSRNPSNTFGHLLYLDQPIEEAPKFRALVEDWIE